MKILLSLIVMLSSLFSSVYYSKLEPYEMRDISSSVAGLILSVDDDMIGKKLSTKPFIVIDAKLDKNELKLTKQKLVSLKDKLLITKLILDNLEKLLIKKRKNYKRIVSLKIKSDFEKDKEFYSLITSENQYSNTEKEMLSIDMQIADIENKIAYLNRSISDKNISQNGFVLYSTLVKAGKFVGIGTPLAQVADTSKGILSIYISSDDMLHYKNKVIYLDGVKTVYKISRILNIADKKNISNYMAQIIIPTPKIFSKLIKVELRDE